MNQKPLLSIVTPTYNRAGIYLRQAIESTLAQSFKDFEFIIIDDCSTDNTQELIASFNDSRIRLIVTNKNYGEYHSTNYGVSLSLGSYFTWIHSDDTLTENSLENRVNFLKNNPDVDFVHGNIIGIDQDGVEFKKVSATERHDSSVFDEYVSNLVNGKCPSLIHHTSIMMKRNFFYKTGPFDCSLPYAGDIDWLVRAVRIGNYRNIPVFLYYYRSHPPTTKAL